MNLRRLLDSNSPTRMSTSSEMTSCCSMIAPRDLFDAGAVLEALSRSSQSKWNRDGCCLADNIAGATVIYLAAV